MTGGEGTDISGGIIEDQYISRLPRAGAALSGHRSAGV